MFPFIPLQAPRSASVEKERSKDLYNLCVPDVAFEASMRIGRVFQTCVVELPSLNLRRKQSQSCFSTGFPPKGRLDAARNKITIRVILYKALKFQKELLTAGKAA